MTARELKPTEFTERLEPIFRSVESRLPENLRGRKSEYFFPHWRHLMELGVARTWEIPNAVLGMFCTPDIFGGVSQASVVFWFSIPGTPETIRLLEAAETAATKCNAAIQIAAYDGLDGDRIAEIYRSRGYVQTERIFRKEITK